MPLPEDIDEKLATGDRGGPPPLPVPPTPGVAGALRAIVAGGASAPAPAKAAAAATEGLALAGAVWERNCMERASARIIDDSWLTRDA